MMEMRTWQPGSLFMMGHIHYLYTRADAAVFAGWPRVYR